MAGSFVPAYLELGIHELQRRAEEAVAALVDCSLCPRDCGVDRLANAWSACKTGRYALVSSAFPHFGEEDCLRGWNGSGTIFFGHCNLRCVFCQNYDISQDIKPPKRSVDPTGTGSEAFGSQVSAVGRAQSVYGAESRPPTADRPSVPLGSRPEELAATMFSLQERGCHNINFVTPEHVVPQILEALVLAVEAGLHLPLVYNTSAYDSLHSIELMEHVVDIYMPDFKYWSEEASAKYLKAADYPEAARRAIKAMHDQVGPLAIDENGLARRGLLIRHLVMPGALDETRAILEWISRELGRDTYVNLMEQYHPAGKVSSERYAEINRRLTTAEFREARRIAGDLGLRRLDERWPDRRLRRRLIVG